MFSRECPTHLRQQRDLIDFEFNPKVKTWEKACKPTAKEISEIENPADRRTSRGYKVHGVTKIWTTEALPMMNN